MLPIDPPLLFLLFLSPHFLHYFLRRLAYDKPVWLSDVKDGLQIIEIQQSGTYTITATGGPGGNGYSYYTGTNAGVSPVSYDDENSRLFFFSILPHSISSPPFPRLTPVPSSESSHKPWKLYLAIRASSAWCAGLLVGVEKVKATVREHSRCNYF